MRNFGIVIFLFTICKSNYTFSQEVIGSSKFDFKVEFDKKISLKNMKLSYFKGLDFHRISYWIDTKTNSIFISGSYSYFIHADFPILLFATSAKEINSRGESIEVTHNRYLISRTRMPVIKNMAKPIQFHAYTTNILLEADEKHGSCTIRNESDFSLLEIDINHPLVTIQKRRNK